jgi:hypothetical protein
MFELQPPVQKPVAHFHHLISCHSKSTGIEDQTLKMGTERNYFPQRQQQLIPCRGCCPLCETTVITPQPVIAKISKTFWRLIGHSLRRGLTRLHVLARTCSAHPERCSLLRTADGALHQMLQPMLPYSG